MATGGAVGKLLDPVLTTRLSGPSEGLRSRLGKGISYEGAEGHGRLVPINRNIRFSLDFLKDSKDSLMLGHVMSFCMLFFFFHSN